MENNKTIAKRITEARKVKGLSQKELGMRLGVSQQMIAQYEKGLRMPKLQTVQKIAEALDIPLFSLIDGISDYELYDRSKLASAIASLVRSSNKFHEKELFSQFDNKLSEILEIQRPTPLQLVAFIRNHHDLVGYLHRLGIDVDYDEKDRTLIAEWEGKGCYISLYELKELESYVKSAAETWVQNNWFETFKVYDDEENDDPSDQDSNND